MDPVIDSVTQPVCQGTAQPVDFKVELFIVVSLIIVVYVLYSSSAYASDVVLYCTSVYTQARVVFQESRMPYSGEGNTFEILGCLVHSVSIFVHAYVPPLFVCAAWFFRQPAPWTCTHCQKMEPCNMQSNVCSVYMCLPANYIGVFPTLRDVISPILLIKHPHPIPYCLPLLLPNPCASITVFPLESQLFSLPTIGVWASCIAHLSIPVCSLAFQLLWRRRT
jgi:hypothetical protein